MKTFSRIIRGPEFDLQGHPQIWVEIQEDGKPLSRSIMLDVHKAPGLTQVEARVNEMLAKEEAANQPPEPEYEILNEDGSITTL